MTRPLAPLALALVVACKTAGPPSPAPATEPASSAAAVAPSIDPSAVDPTVKPCDDFYAYACGGWLKTAAIPPDKPIWSRGIMEMRERNLEALRRIAERDAAGQSDPADRYGRKVGDLWAACMDEEALERRGRSDLESAWARIDGVTDVAALVKEVGLLHRDGIFPIFHIASDQDARDATQVIGTIVQGGLGLPDRDYYLQDDARGLEIQRAYRAHIARMLELGGAAPAQAGADAEAIFRLERALAEAHWSRVDMRDPQKTYHRVELAGLEKAAPRFGWKAYLVALGHPGLTAFSTTTPQFLPRVEQLLQDAPASTWRAYLRWRVLSSMAAQRAVPRALSDERFSFLSKNFTGAKEQEARWKHCVHVTDVALGEALGQSYVRRHFGPDGKEKTNALVSDVEGAMGRDVDGLSWMDAATKARAREKLARVANKVGYPDSWRNYDALQVDRGSFFRSVLAASAFEVNRDLDKIGKPLDRNEWQMTPATVNAYYNPSMNEIVFPAGILQHPLYTRGAPDAFNYGAIGMVVGHELTHGFDDTGRQFDAVGNLVDWWTPAVGTEFERRAACVVKQYDEYVAVDDVKLKGALTLGENIADLGGLKLAFAAYRASRQGKAPEPPVAGYTPEQAFFVGFAQSWCTIRRPEYARMMAQTDTHSPAQWRVNGPLSNLLEFRQAFACPDGSKMARAGVERCEVW
jgi:putative endopeptidase